MGLSISKLAFYVLCHFITFFSSSAAVAKQPIVWDGIGWIPIIEELRPPFPYPPKSDSWKSPNSTIFVGIAAYRDSRCPKTLYNMYTKAKYPDRLFVGLVQQSDDKNDVDCVAKFCELMGANTGMDKRGNADVERAKKCPYFNNIRVNRVSHHLARGPTFGRHLQSYLIHDEEFCMQTDSHMDYVEHWDQKLVDMWGMIQNEYAIIATYVNDFADIAQNDHGQGQAPHICQLEFVDNGMPRNKQAKGAIGLTRPKLTTLWAAGFSFLKCHGEKQTPNDPQLPGVFDGEEYSKGARMWTRGYDIYTPHLSLIVHDYNKPKDYDPLGWDRDDKSYKRSKKRLFTLLEMERGENTTEARKALGRYGLGDRRTLNQYIKFTGVDIRHRKAFESRCGTIDWMPFEEHPLGPEGPLLEQFLEFGAFHPKQWPTSITRKQLEAYFTPEELIALRPAAKGYDMWPMGSSLQRHGGFAQRLLEEGSSLSQQLSLEKLKHVEEEAVKEIERLAEAKVVVTLDGLAIVLLSTTFAGMLCFCLLLRCYSKIRKQNSNVDSVYEATPSLKQVNNKKPNTLVFGGHKKA